MMTFLGYLWLACATVPLGFASVTSEAGPFCMLAGMAFYCIIEGMARFIKRDKEEGSHDE